MSLCRTCGTDVTWARKPGGGTHPPLEYDGTRYVIQDGVAQSVATYARHRCNPAAVERWEEELSNRQRAAEVYEDELALAWKKAKKRVCPKCEAKRNAPCVNMTVRKRTGKEEPTRWPHAERYA